MMLRLNPAMPIEDFFSPRGSIWSQLLGPLVVSMLISACSTNTNSFIPQAMASQIDWTLSFQQIKESPSTYQGSVVLLGGEILTAKRLKDHTRIIVLQLPLSTGEEPVTNRTQSKGRFIAKQTEFLDPETIPPGTRVTVIGEISGSTTELLDEMEYQYPVLTIKHLEVWPPPQQFPNYYPSYYDPYYPYPYFWY